MMCAFREASETDDWTLYWTDYSVSLDRVIEMKSYQVFVVTPVVELKHLPFFIHKEQI